MATPALLPDLALTCRRIFFRDLIRNASIGVHDFERLDQQRLRFDIDIWVSLVHCTPEVDSLDEVVDYDFVTSILDTALLQRHYDLQETLGDRILDSLLAQPKLVAARVCTTKLDIFGGCGSVGLETFRFNTRQS